MYQLDRTLAADTCLLGQLTLCDVLLMDNSSYTWLILVPRRENIRETYELNDADQQLLATETNFIGAKLATLTQAHKINIAAIGNIVSQLHVHIVARHTDDPLWPKPIWGHVQHKPYSSKKKQEITQKLNALLFNN